MDLPNITVRVREDGDLFFRRSQTTLSFSDTHVHFGVHSLPFLNLTVSNGLASHDIVITTPRTAFCIRPVDKHNPQWPTVRARLTLCLLSPPGYLYLHRIGHGAFGTVYKARRVHSPPRSPNFVAIKHICKRMLQRRKLSLASARRELRIATAVPPHPNIARTLHAFETTRSLFLVMEYVEGGSLLKVARAAAAAEAPLSVPSVRLIMQQLLSAVAHLHSLSILHRDIKMENVLIHRTAAGTLQAKLCDFGLAIEQPQLTHAVGAMPVGTGFAHPPELVLAGEMAAHTITMYAPSADVWALGVILFVLLYHHLPCMENQATRPARYARMLQLAADAKPFIHEIQSVEQRLATPPLLHSLLCGLLQPQPSKRLTARAALEHAFFRSSSSPTFSCSLSPFPAQSNPDSSSDSSSAASSSDSSSAASSATSSSLPYAPVSVHHPPSARHAFKRVLSLVHTVHSLRECHITSHSNRILVS